jgi:hydroxymethylpyrimidine kinase/phosphomethylpyrimidine kinase/thiamine-phosphate diphosphorylase
MISSDWEPDEVGPAARAKVVACSLGEAQQSLGDPLTQDSAAAPAVARRLRETGAGAVCIVDVAGPGGRPLHWLDSEHAQGWLAPATGTVRRSGDSRLFARQMAAAMGRGFVAADAAVLATMATTSRPAARDHSAEEPEFVHDPALLPQLSWGEAAHFADKPAGVRRRLDLYAIVDSAERLQQVLAAGVRTLQLRIKTPPAPDAAWHAMLRREVQRSVLACEAAGAELFINDHWQLAGELGAHGVHLGQEDLLALDESGRSALQATGLALGVSSHSLWELCRARALAPRYIACGPVWPTLTKAMPWRPQGLDNLSWWCRMAGAPVVAIGGVLGAEEVREAARCGADGVCIVRGLGEHPERVVPALRAALEAGRAQPAAAPTQADWPHPSLPLTD